MLYSRVQTLLRQRRRKQQKLAPEISAPFDLKLEPVVLPGVSEDELSFLREKAVANRISVAELVPRTPSSAFAQSRASSLKVPSTENILIN
ncbi:hypothetical protein N3K66_002081 [Trichothecium roseum]|uniref:Uncharacterized protein n=1 Tax=Trichothecium roseum TaxID=47278 RepID=A0ACC0V936_9HYPO|nr:hypothetical protein N3K66_002081 [Trichothecium roseum]